MAADKPAVLVENVRKRFGETEALRGLDLSVQPGQIVCLLGPNGAGKTTAVRIMATLLRPDSGRVEVAGLDVVRDAHRLRSLIGLTGQYAAVDEYLTGRENLDMFGRLYKLPRRATKARTAELLARFELTDAANRPVKTYSGGMRRRLDLAASLVVSPPVLFLDEPTTGLDPRSRLGMWEVVRGLTAAGTSVLLTTQYLEEADQLADDIYVIDHGQAIAHGTADQLKSQIGGERLEITMADPGDLELAADVLRGFGDGIPHVDTERRKVAVAVKSRTGLLTDVVRELDGTGAGVQDLAMRRPTLDDVFLVLTGHSAEPVAELVEVAS
ncbi:ATP-binding cassette domain-containing protein [Fodinicola feengrottensis]|uniref:Daunorubicin resistance protein DrrA family ABC transporter ATP-binding protein n=1 Tax=Fodinicola feengrottensis TaxID=435914 RepID=A0ABN2I9P9_9ACTN|nr:ATP-binding cassette domain-containing protein [Fodinicola feengrottensis]